jgi:CRP-like cAMP-binding protein
MSLSLQPTVDLLRELEDVFAEHEPLRIRFAPKELISQAGSYAAGIYLITSGIVHESYAEGTGPGHEVSTGLLGPLSLIGSELLLPDGLRLHRVSCRAVTGVSLSFLERSAFETAVEAHDVLRRFLAAHLAGRSFDLIRAVWRSQLKPVERVGALLHDLAPFGEPTEDGRTALPVEIDLRRLADLAYVSHRKAKQACEALSSMEWDGGRFVLSLEELDGYCPRDIRSQR